VRVLVWTLYRAHNEVAVHNVTVGGHQAEFSHHDALANISMGSSSEAHDCHKHPELKRKVYSALQESDEGDLSIAIPKEVPLRQTSTTGMVYNDGMTHFVAPFLNANLYSGATPEPATPNALAGQTMAEFSPIVINIAYSLRNPVDGVEFVLPSDNHPYVSFSNFRCALMLKSLCRGFLTSIHHPHPRMPRGVGFLA
jgi:transcription initiation factor TFIID subunit 2